MPKQVGSLAGPIERREWLNRAITHME